MMQLIHEDDVLNAIVHAVQSNHPGAFNIAAEDLLPLSKITGLAQKIRLPVFHLFAYWGYGLIGGSGLRLSRHIPIELDYIRYRWIGDLKKMQHVFKFEPTFTAEEALREFAVSNRNKPVTTETVSALNDTNRFKQIIERRQQDMDPHIDQAHVDKNVDLEGDDHE